MIIRRLGDAFARQDWFVVLIELIVLVVGIFIGLQVDDWNEARKDRAEEQVYLEELREDFEANEQLLLGNIRELEKVNTDMIALMEQSALDQPEWDTGRINDAFRQVHRMPSFLAVSRAYDNLTGAGDLKLLSSRELKNRLAQYYAAAELVELVMNTHEMELVHTFQPYVIENADFQAIALTRVEDFPLPPPVEEDRLLVVLQTREFRNILVQKWTICTDLLALFRRMLERTREVLSMLRSESGSHGVLTNPVEAPEQP